MRLVLNENPKWTETHLDFFIRHEMSFGLYISEADYQEQLNCIESGNPQLRCGSNQKCYEIFQEVGEAYLGDIIVDEQNETSIYIFDEYAGNSYASQALNDFVQEFRNSYPWFEAVVREENPEKEKIKKVLLNAGFNLMTNYGNEVWRFECKCNQ